MKQILVIDAGEVQNIVAAHLTTLLGTPVKSDMLTALNADEEPDEEDFGGFRITIPLATPADAVIKKAG